MNVHDDEIVEELGNQCVSKLDEIRLTRFLDKTDYIIRQKHHNREKHLTKMFLSQSFNKLVNF